MRLLDLLKRYPLARFIAWLLFAACIFSFSLLIGRTVTRKPYLESITPPVGSPGDTLVLSGKNFGISRLSSYVEIAGSRITSSGYIEWTDTQIKVVLPTGIEDGLVVVGTSAGKSNPSFFANESKIPLAVVNDRVKLLPSIQKIECKNPSIGASLTITGANFGSVRGSSQVYFSNSEDKSFVTANATEYDYEYWSDTEIRLRIPDGANGGKMFVQTEKGRSSYLDLSLEFPVGKKEYPSSRTYVISTSADIQNKAGGEDSRITLYLPRPQICAWQPKVDVTKIEPEPLIKSDSRDIIQQTSVTRQDLSKQRFNQTFAVQVYEVRSNIQEERVRPYSSALASSTLISLLTSPDSCVSSNDSRIIDLSKSLVAREKNPYRQAKILYEYLVNNFALREEIRTGDVDALDMLSLRYGDAYDFAILYTALCRAVGIAAMPVSGIVVDTGNVARNHWWTELYFENFGFFPVDCASALSFENAKSYYFGNLEGRHIVFSRGWNQIKPSMLNGKIVYRPRTYALQSIWEEASESTSNYSSLWNNPIIIGIEQIR